LARNTGWNLLGQLLPLVVSVAAIPPLVHGLGIERFGILSLAWIIIGYFSLFDLGIGRALTKLVADKFATGELDSAPPLVWTSLMLMLLLGVAGGLAMWALSPWLVHKVRKIPEALQLETLHSFYLLALSVPLVTVTAGLRGVLEAQQRFRIVNLIRIPMTIFLLIGPLLVLPFSHNLVLVIALLIAARVIGLIVHQIACFRAMPILRRNFSLQRSLVAPLLRYGVWMTVSNILGPIVFYGDRFLIGALLSVTAVTYYTVPFDAMIRLTVFPAAIAGVLFPAFAVSVIQSPERTALLLNRGVKYVFLGIFPIVLTVVTLAPEILRLWLGMAFAENSATVLRWLAAGILMNCIATIPFSLLQGIGRPDVTGKVLLVELPISVALLWWLIMPLGIKGAAIAWGMRAALEAIIYLALSRRCLFTRALSLKPIVMSLSPAVALLCIATLPSRLVSKGAFLAISLTAFGLVSWFFVLKHEERSFLTGSRPSLQIYNSTD
jgi:O-antigen/teichoic acid export membrane protein